MRILATGTDDLLVLGWNRGGSPLVSLEMLAKDYMSNIAILSHNEGNGNFLA